MGLTYHIPPEIQVTHVHGHPALTTTQGGKIIMDRLMIDLWRQADNQDINDILANQGAGIEQQAIIRAALACLAEAGLLLRHTGEVVGRQAGAPQSIDHSTPSQEDTFSALERVSVIIVTHNSQIWLENCITSLLNQSHDNLELIIVDNASTDQTKKWIKENYQNEINLIQLDQARSLAHAINQGVKHAHGEFLLVLNPDVELHDKAIARLVAAAHNEPNCAAVAAKLRFLWAPGFLNGLGNYVGAISWGGDSALGHLDLGQFDHWNQIPSACFAAAFIPRKAWQIVGPLDEGFPLYYEDSEWCYRGRLLGYQVIAAPQAIVYHAFGGHGQTQPSAHLSPQKLRRVVFGRLRFITKLLKFPRLLRFFAGYLVEDCGRFLIALIRGRWQLCKAFLLAWKDYFYTLRSLIIDRRIIHARRKITDAALFYPQRRSPIPLLWHGYPQLTWDILGSNYLKLILEQKTSVLPEFENINYDYGTQPFWSRLQKIQKIEGLDSLLHHIGKNIQWRLSQP